MAKIGRLPQEQFFDVSSDLHDELHRRLHNPEIPFLPINSNLLPKRNQARQKMATLPETRFKELAAELFFEIERRYPNVAQEYNGRFGNVPPPPEQEPVGLSRTRSGREPREPREARRERQETTSEGRRRRDPSGERYRPARERSRDPGNRYPSYRSEEPINTQELEHQEEISKIRSDYEFKVAMLEKQLKERNSGEQQNGIQLKKMQERIALLDKDNQGLQNDYDRLKAEYDKTAKDVKLWEQKALKAEQNYAQLAKEFDLVKKELLREQDIATGLEEKVIKGEDRYAKLEQDYVVVQKSMDNMKRDNAEFLSDIQNLKEKQRVLESERDSLRKELGKVQNDLQRANETITKVGNVKPPPVPIPEIKKPVSPKMSPKTPIPVSPTASIQTVKDEDISTIDKHFKDYQKFANELLQLSKKENRAQVLGPMKGILLTCKQITQECENKEDDPGLGREDKEALIDVKQKLSECLTHLMSATKDHASGTNSKSSTLIEEEVSRLSFCISDLLELLKIINANVISKPSKRDTMRSTLDGNGNPTELPPFTLEELRDYLEEQIDNIAHAIQDLLQEMKKPETNADEISALVNEISQFVDNIIYESQGTIDTAPGMTNELLNDADDVLAILSDIRSELLDLGEDILDHPQDRQIKQKVANSSYEVAKHAKDLLTLLDGLPCLEKSLSEMSRAIIHLDLDCFYCQVEQVSRNIVNEPLVVQQWNGILSVNYQARDLGITRKWTAKDVKEKLPKVHLAHVPVLQMGETKPTYSSLSNIQTQKASLSVYRSASIQIMKLIESICPNFQKASIDEAYLDVTDMVNEIISKRNWTDDTTLVWDSDTFHAVTTVETSKSIQDARLLVACEISKQVRTLIHDTLGYTASTGIASNKTLAKLISSLNKPNKQTVLRNSDVLEYMKSIPFSKIKGLGGKFGRKVDESFPVAFASDLWKFSVTELQATFGMEDGKWLYDISRGICNAQVTKTQLSKSIQSIKSFAKKLTKIEDVEKWVFTMSAEIYDRVNEDFIETGRWPRNLAVNVGDEAKHFKFPHRESMHDHTVLFQMIWKTVSLPQVCIGYLSMVLTGMEKANLSSIKGWLTTEEQRDGMLELVDEDGRALFFKCLECGEAIEIVKKQEHQDHHFALSLSRSFDPVPVVGVKRKSSSLEKGTLKAKERPVQKQDFFRKRIK